MGQGECSCPPSPEFTTEPSGYLIRKNIYTREKERTRLWMKLVVLQRQWRRRKAEEGGGEKYDDNPVLIVDEFQGRSVREKQRGGGD